MYRKHYNFTIKDEKTENNNFIFSGIASTYEKDLHNDIILKGAFTETLKKRTPVILYQHNSDMPVGMPTDLKETNQGLEFTAKLPLDDDFVANRVIPQIKIGSLKGVSIGFSCDKENINFDEKSNCWLISKLDLYEFSIVTFPANLGATIESYKNMTTSLKSLCSQKLDDNKKVNKLTKSIDQLIINLNGEYL